MTLNGYKFELSPKFALSNFKRIRQVNEWMNTYIYIAPVKQKSSEALAAE